MSAASPTPESIRHALVTDRVIDITTTGRASGKEHRIETWFHNLDGQVYLTGSPGKRDWYANLVANPDFTFHLKSVGADLPAHATAVTDPAQKREIFTVLLANLDRSQDIDTWVEKSPLVAVDLPTVG
ncbi:MAG TPA: nitroreductase/quinone reductase family protein [Thermomicrobiales bacterium]|nr:nitroreductase/quinone reductase family protein [Thermomicrobiales bacterium]